MDDGWVEIDTYRIFAVPKYHLYSAVNKRIRVRSCITKSAIFKKGLQLPPTKFARSLFWNNNLLFNFGHVSVKIFPAFGDLRNTILKDLLWFYKAKARDRPTSVVGSAQKNLDQMLVYYPWNKTRQSASHAKNVAAPHSWYLNKAPAKNLTSGRCDGL